MDNYEKLKKYAVKLYASHGITLHVKDKYAIIEQTAIYIDALLFNIVSIYCLIATINDSSRITSETLHVGNKYLEDKCDFSYSMSGGRLGSATFLGMNEPMYSVNNPTHDILNIDFNSDIIRPQIGGAHVYAKIISTCVNAILKYHHIKASKHIKHAIISTILFHIQCFIDCLRKCKGPIKKNMIEKIVKRHKILRPLH